MKSWYPEYMINAIQIALSGLTAASKRADASASNIANAQSNGALAPSEGPAPYQPVETVQSASENGGVVSHNIPSSRPAVPVYDADSSYSDDNGLIGAPAVDMSEEIINLKIAEIAYKANIKTMQTAFDMQNELLNIIDKDKPA